MAPQEATMTIMRMAVVPVDGCRSFVVVVVVSPFRMVVGGIGHEICNAHISTRSCGQDW